MISDQGPATVVAGGGTLDKGYGYGNPARISDLLRNSWFGICNVRVTIGKSSGLPDYRRINL